MECREPTGKRKQATLSSDWLPAIDVLAKLWKPEAGTCPIGVVSL